MRWVVMATIAGSIFFVIMPIYILAIRVAEGRKETEWLAIAFLVFGFGSAAVYLCRHLKGMSQSVKVTDEVLAHGSTEMKWSEITSVWDSGFFSMLRIKSRGGRVLTFFQGMQGYSILAAIAKEKMAANKSPQSTTPTVAPPAASSARPTEAKGQEARQP